MSECSAQVIERTEFREDPAGPNGQEFYARTITVSQGKALQARIEVTPKGNGTLTLANLRLRVFDEHDDGQVYENGLLHTEFVDLDEDGDRDLVVFGTVLHTGEDGGDAVREAVLAIYMFKGEGGVFERTLCIGRDLSIR